MLQVCDFQQIVQRARQLNQIVCFGAGKRLNLMEEIFGNTVVWEKTEYVVDNNIEKQNTHIVVGGKKLRIISPDELKRRFHNNFAIIITCADYAEIANQLLEDNILQNIDFFCLTHIHNLKMEAEALQKEIPPDLKLYDKPLIPKVIHYCWFGGNPLPDRYKSWMESWHKFCPDYEIKEWNEYNYDISKNVYMHQAYECKKWGFVPDYARLDIIYKYGGIYLDTDVELIRPIDDLLFQKGFAGFQYAEQVALGLGFGAVKGLPIMKEMLDFYKNLTFINEDGSLNMVPSPVWQTQVLKRHGLSINGEYQVISDLTIYPEKVLAGKNVFSKKIVLMPYTRAIHHFDGSWNDEKNRDTNTGQNTE